MKPHTAFLGKLLGLFTITMCFWLMVDRSATESSLPALLGDRPAMIVLALMALGAGLAMILAHIIWSGGALPILVTVIGWLLLLKGVVILFLPPQDFIGLLESLHFRTLSYLYFVIPFLVGVCLAFLGFRAEPRHL